MGREKNKIPGPFIRLAALPLGPRFLIYRRFAVASSVVFQEAIVHEDLLGAGQLSELVAFTDMTRFWGID